MPNTRPALTPHGREQRRTEQRELVRASIEQLRTSDGWQAYLKARRRFSSYSWRNVLLILSQHPTAHHVAGFRKWLELGYAVQRGQHGIKIWARCAPSHKRMQAWRNAGADPDERPRATYKLVSVFDRLSRVRSGRCRRRPSREIRCLPSRAWLLVRASATAKGTAVACAVVAESAPEGDGAAAIARAPRRYPREQKRADQMPRMPPPCPHTGNLADRRQVAEGCRLALGAATSPARIAWLHHAFM